MQFVCVLLVVAGLAPPDAGSREPLDDTQMILKAMSDYVSSQQSFEPRPDAFDFIPPVGAAVGPARPAMHLQRRTA